MPVPVATSRLAVRCAVVVVFGPVWETRSGLLAFKEAYEHADSGVSADQLRRKFHTYESV